VCIMVHIVLHMLQLKWLSSSGSQVGDVLTTLYSHALYIMLCKLY
jgi:hypothetical protein